jgi:hypothetical protein
MFALDFFDKPASDARWCFLALARQWELQGAFLQGCDAPRFQRFNCFFE